MSKNCLICSRINSIKNSTNPYFIIELKTGYVVFADHQFFKGYVLFLCKQHKTELHQLDTEYKKNFLIEMSLVAETVFKAFKPEKLNYELLGNKDSHLHWHIIPRYRYDPHPQRAIWAINQSLVNSDKYCPSKIELKKMRGKFIKALKTLQ
ncbi:MAG: HIT family protein [bacterium]